ncbi:MAG: asparagine synthase (glutamine-hydrolyzing), partial [Anaerolineae bacterium]|nr:asparagine synthase (glutamine-hydrolyzing) [Anaerolineae bacterium]
MCGICGIIDLIQHGRVAQETVWHMSQRIVHRGPDGDGFYTTPNIGLGARRLSIIDVPGSDQPLFNEDRSITLIFNGEIYNYRELRDRLTAQGHAFSTDGDGETVIHLYEQHGLDLFHYLRGMYAFALWDSSAERLVLAVDHIGMKPLYLCERDGMLMFASEIKALLADPDVPQHLNLDVLDTYLSFGYMIGPETLFEDIRRLPPGHAYVVEKGSDPCLYPHWDFGRTRPANHWDEHSIDLKSPDSVVKSARELLADAVRIHLRSDVPLGLFLSGGVDSAAMLALMANEAGGHIKTYTIGYDMDVPDNELEQARHIANYFQTDHHERIITADDWWSGFERYVYAHDEPNANPSAVSLLLLSEMTAQHVKVVLTGLGGDELFGGYPFHQTIPQLLERQATWGWLGSDRPGGSPLQRLLALPEPLYPAMKRYRYIGALPTYLPRVRHALLPRNEALLRMQSFDGMVFSDSLRRRLYGPDLRDAWQKAQHREQTYARIVEKSWRDNP